MLISLWYKIFKVKINIIIISNKTEVFVLFLLMSLPLFSFFLQVTIDPWAMIYSMLTIKLPGNTRMNENTKRDTQETIPDVKCSIT